MFVKARKYHELALQEATKSAELALTKNRIVDLVRSVERLTDELQRTRLHETAALAAQDELREANKVLQVNLDWFRLRLTQVESERAKLLYLHTGVKVETPEIAVREEAIEQEHQKTALPDMIAGFAGFQDIGDEEASRQGIDWDEEGKVTYKE